MANSAWSGNTAGLASATSPGLVQAGGYNVLPAGTVLPYAGGTAPTGFLLCQGQEISKTTYAQLYAAIADVYATQIDPTTGSAWAAPSASNFRIPDYRGSFLRSVGTPSVGDAVTLGGHQAQKTSANGLALSGTTTFATSAHTHGPGNYRARIALSGSAIYMERDVAASYNPTQQSSLTVSAGSGSQTVGATLGGASDAASASATVSMGSGDNETRPLNKGVNYIIKY